MELSLLFDDVDRIMMHDVTVSITTKKAISTKKATSDQFLPKKTASNKKVLRGKKLEEETNSKKPKEGGISAKIIEIIEELAEVEDTEAVIEKHITKSLKDGYAEIFHIQQYQQQLSQYRQFLNAYLKGYKDAMAINGEAKMAQYDDPFDKTDVPVPKRDFGVGQEIMTNSEIRDIVRRKRMNWLLGNEHNYVSPDEKERYKFWKLFSKFNYVLAEGCMFNL